LIFALEEEELIFPHPVLREPEGLLAIGGSLTTQRLLLAYRWGIFPWFHEDQPVLWWWLAPRLMVQPGAVHISHSLKKTMDQNKFQVTLNQDFIGVIEHCSSVARKGQDGGTWILQEMIDAYIELHQLGFAHSVEVYENEKLVGGLYGVAMGKIFSGESMFSLKPDASKTGFAHLAKQLAGLGFEWIDCQQDTPHMRSFGGKLIEEEDFLAVLRENHLYMLSDGRKSNFF
jgi:leucyl/phenylalanyl-tRNA--protein transferase